MTESLFLAALEQTITKELAALKTQAEASMLQQDLHHLIHYANTATQLLARRIGNKQTYAEKHLYIPLGEDCFGRAVLHQLGYKKARSEGEPSYPFDLSITPCLSSAQLIRSKFADFMDPKQLTFNGRHPAHGKYQIEFNHEQGKEFAGSGFSLLRKRYAKRVANFYNAIRSHKSVVFIVHNYHADRPIQASHLSYLETSIKECICNLNFRIAYIETCGLECDGLRDVSQCTTKLSAGTPPNYIWYDNSHRYSLRGLNFALRLDNIFNAYLKGID